MINIFLGHMGMQKKKKVSKMKASDKKAKPAAKVAAKPAAKPAKKAAEKPAPAKKEVAPKQQAAPKVKAPKAPKAAKVKVEAKPAHTAENPATNAPISKDDFKNMSADAQEHYKKWLKLHKQLSVEKANEYKMTEDFELKAPLSHKVHGWGVVMQKRDNYIDVLFEAGVKTLIVNYKP
jgi:hypothetical protein